MKAIPKLTEKELTKWLGILGAEKIKWLYIESKINLTQKQLDFIIEKSKSEKDKRINRVRG